MHWKLLALLAGLTINSFSLPAIAEKATVLRVTSQHAQGTSETGAQRIGVGLQGVTLSFLPTGETIQKVWLDDPSKVVIDFDGCLTSNAGDNSSSGSSCNGASMIHIRELPKAIEFPAGYFPKMGNVSLTVITTGGGSRKVYQFELLLGHVTPPYRTVEIIPSSPPAPAQLVSVSQEYQRSVLQQLSKGLAYAESQKLIDTSSPAYAQVKATIALMEKGTPFADATRQTGVPSRLIDTLRAHGTR